MSRVLLEGAAFESAVVHPEAVRVNMATQEGALAESLAAGAGGAGACLETSFARGSPDKVFWRPNHAPRYFGSAGRASISHQAASTCADMIYHL